MVNVECAGKQEFKTPVLAQKVAARTNRNGKGQKGIRRVYRCLNHSVPTWHIGEEYLRRDRKTLK